MNYLSAFSDERYLPEDRFMRYSIPKWLKGNGDDAIVICLHGYTATVYEAAPVAEACFAAGTDAACPLIPGHGLKDEKYSKVVMGEIQYEDWLGAIRNEIAKARKLYRKIYIYGQSMGGAIALRMAEEGLVDACAVTAPAVKLNNLYELIIGKLGKFSLNYNLYIPATHNLFNESYTYYNSLATIELLKMSQLVRENLSSITCPLLACFTPDDDAVDAKGAADLIRNNVKDARIKWFLGCHCMTLDDSAEDVKASIAGFFLKQKIGVTI